MYEHSRSKLASKRVYRNRLLRSGLLSVTIFSVSLLIGITGYHITAGLGWVDSFLNASMILGGMGPVDMLQNRTAKLFAGCYSLFSGVAFLSAMAIFLTPILHRFLHKFHLDLDESQNKK